MQSPSVWWTGKCPRVELRQLTVAEQVESRTCALIRRRALARSASARSLLRHFVLRPAPLGLCSLPKRRAQSQRAGLRLKEVFAAARIKGEGRGARGLAVSSGGLRSPPHAEERAFEEMCGRAPAPSASAQVGVARGGGSCLHLEETNCSPPVPSILSERPRGMPSLTPLPPLPIAREIAPQAAPCGAWPSAAWPLPHCALALPTWPAQWKR